MKRSTFSALSLSAFSLLMAAGAIAPSAQALPKLNTNLDSDYRLQTLRLREMDARNKSDIESKFNLQTLRLDEFDARNKGDESYYPQPSAQPSSQSVTAEQDSAETAEATAWESSESQEEEEASAELSVTERRRQVLDRS